MPLPPVVLVATTPGDLGADLVIRDLGGREVDVHRISLADLTNPNALRLTGRVGDGQLHFHLSDEYRTTASAALVSAFWWHPGVPEGWMQNESRAALESLLFGLDGVTWVNHPVRAMMAKPGAGQLRKAAQTGFLIPASLYTNDPAEAISFAHEHGGRVVCKTLTAHAQRFIQARLVTAEEIEAEAEGVRQGVHIFQELVVKTHDVRLTVVGERLFPCKVWSETDELDWRIIPEGELHYEPVSVSRPLAGKVLKLMRVLGLEYAALDFAVDRSGSWWFLEANPFGQFGFIQASTGMAISRAIADHLAQSAMLNRVFTPDGGHRASSGWLHRGAGR